MSSSTMADSRIPRNLAPVEPRSLLAPALVFAGIVGFFLVHTLLVMIVPKTLAPMIVGGTVPDAEATP